MTGTGIDCFGLFTHTGEVSDLSSHTNLNHIKEIHNKKPQKHNADGILGKNACVYTFLYRAPINIYFYWIKLCNFTIF